MRVPVVMMGERWVSAGDLDAVAEFLGLGPTGFRMLRPAELFERYDRILEATQRYLSVFPPEKMKMTVPRREKRDMRELGYHVFAVADDFMTVKDGDQYAQGNQPVPESVQTFNEIIAYGGMVRKRLGVWFEAQDPGTWDRMLSTSYGKLPVHRYFERATWHSGQHLRQIVEMLRLAGGSPVEPLPSDFFDGLPIPEQLWE